MHLSLADDVGDERGVEQDLEGGDPALPMSGGEQLLGDDGAQVEGEIEQELAVLLLGDQMQDAIQRLVGIVGVQGGEAEVPRLGELDGELHGLLGADFTDEDDIRGLAQGIFEGDIEGCGVDPHLPLGHQAAIVLMDELHRILHRQDVAVTVLVAKADHGRLGGGLAGTGGADEEHQPAFGHGDLLQDGRQHQLVKGGDAGLDAAQHHARHILLPEGADPKAPQRASLDGVVGLAGVQETLEVGLVQALPDQRQRRRIVEGGWSERHQTPVDLEGRGGIDRDEEIRALLFNQCGEQNIHVHGDSLGVRA